MGRAAARYNMLPMNDPIDMSTGSRRIVLVGDGGAMLATGLSALGHRVDEIPAEGFHGVSEMVDVVAILPGCEDGATIGAVAAACARMVWFQEEAAPEGLGEILSAAGVTMVDERCLLRECQGK